MDESIDIIEGGYEFLLAYAAQGRDTDTTGGDKPSEVRRTLEQMRAAAEAIQSALAESTEAFHAVVVDDARKSHAALSLVLAQPAISSEIVDNLNASIHLRALLTDLFLLSEAQSPG